MARTDILRVYVYVPQAYAAFVQEGSTAYLDFAEFPGEKIQGKVAHIAGAIDPATRTLQTEIQVDNKESRLFPGAFANVHLSLPLKKAPTVVPVNTLLFRKEGLQVATVGMTNGIVHLKKVTIGQDFGTSLEVTSGVTKEDRIVVNPSDSLQDGAKVEAKRATAGKGSSSVSYQACPKRSVTGEFVRAGPRPRSRLPAISRRKAAGYHAWRGPFGSLHSPQARELWGKRTRPYQRRGALTGALRIASRGAGTPNQRSNDSAPRCRSSRTIRQPPCAPASRAAASSGVGSPDAR